MSLGKELRLGRLFSHPSGRLCSVAADHFIGYQDGLPKGLRDLPRTIAAIAEGRPDALTLHKGAAIHCGGILAGRVPLIVQSIAGRPDDSADEHLALPLDAVRLGADAFAIAAFVRGATEAAHLRRVADLVRQAEEWAMPVILHIYPRRFLPEGKVELVHTPEDIAWTLRCGVELGVDVIKTPYTGDPQSFGQLVEECPAPVVAAGGPKAATLRQALELAEGVVKSGAAGLTVGRNVWGFADITGAVRAFKAVIHEGKNAGEALKQEGLEGE